MSDVHEPWVYVVRAQCPECDWVSEYARTRNNAIPAGREIDAVVMRGDERCVGCGKLWSDMDGISPSVTETLEARRDYATPDEEPEGGFSAEDFEIFRERVLETAERMVEAATPCESKIAEPGDLSPRIAYSEAIERLKAMRLMCQEPGVSAPLHEIERNVKEWRDEGGADRTMTKSDCMCLVEELKRLASELENEYRRRALVRLIDDLGGQYEQR